MTGQSRIEIKVYRYDPETDRAPHYETYQVPTGRGYMVLNALNFIRENYDPTLRFRHSCHMAKCGSCAVMVNGHPGLACWELLQTGSLYSGLSRIQYPSFSHRRPIEKHLLFA